MESIEKILGNAVSVDDGKVSVRNEGALKSDKMDRLVRVAVFGEKDEKDQARWLLWEIGQAVGVKPASIHDLYMARGRGECHGFTVPAINVRGMSYETGRAIFRTANKLKAGAFILEIARSEIGYTDQRPSEYVSVMLGAALREGFRGPLFIQGDHFQVNHKKFASDARTEVDAVKALVREAVAAGFYNIDIDTSTLVDLKQKTLLEQQRLNYEVGIDILRVVREVEPKGVTISIGGEIGEVGTENSTEPELRAYMDGFNTTLPKGMTGLSKISVQSGTSHGGVVLPDGSIADVALDLDTLERLSKVARDEYGLAGAVQHGASTLPDRAFNNFPKREACEIHLATNFQNMLYDALPKKLREEVYAWLRENAKDERKATDSDEQFYYKTRKKALGPFKRKFWDLPEETRVQLGMAYDDKFEFLFKQLHVDDTAKHVAKHVKPVAMHKAPPGAGLAAVAAAPDDTSLSD